MIEEQLKAELNVELDRLANKRGGKKSARALLDYTTELEKFLTQYPNDLYKKYSNDLSKERFKEIFTEVTNSRNSEIRIG